MRYIIIIKLRKLSYPYLILKFKHYGYFKIENKENTNPYNFTFQSFEGINDGKEINLDLKSIGGKFLLFNS